MEDFAREVLAKINFPDYSDNALCAICSYMQSPQVNWGDLGIGAFPDLPLGANSNVPVTVVINYDYGSEA